MIEIKSSGVPIKAWVEGVPVEDEATLQLRNVAKLPIVWPHVAVMPDVHWGIGATVGSVDSDAWCDHSSGRRGRSRVWHARCSDQPAPSDLPDSLVALRSAIEAAIPHGRTNNGAPGDRGAWGTIPVDVANRFSSDMAGALGRLCAEHPKLASANAITHLGTLGTGNHFVEVCLDTDQGVWVMLHSGSRGVGNRIGSYFIALAKEDMQKTHGHLPEDKDLAYLTEGTEHFADYVAP